ncbi:DUF6602 domain-containing protein [Actinoplanes awajinensis]|uniref:DUF6602 domain-containing protein n=1 Tax=Actinoplanes awajinensis TaxID=135946 RepID=UPI0012F9E5B1|nr:DUF6602 domain-containing protein [Actinoplanes awajinensis]
MNRVNSYLNSAADLLAAKGGIAGHSSHKLTIGHNREQPLVEFLNLHLPTRLNAQLGGTVVSHLGEESAQIDVLVTNDLGLRFEANDRPFVMTEAVAAAISVKSDLDKAAIFDSLDGLLSIPAPSPDVLTFPTLRNDPFAAYTQRHPTLWMFGYDGAQANTCLGHLQAYVDDKGIDAHARSRICAIVNRRYTISYHIEASTTHLGDRIEANSFHVSELGEGMQGYALARLINQISHYTDWVGYASTSFHPYFTT